jgi:flagellar basal body-associated protein FliL
MPGAPPRRSNTALIIAIVVMVLLLFGALAGFAVWRFWPVLTRSAATTTTTSTSTTTMTTSSARPSQTTLDVTQPTPVLIDNTTSATTTAAPTTTLATTPQTSSTTPPIVMPPTTTRAPRPTPVEHQEEAAPEEEAPEPEAEPAPSSVLTFREKGDGNSNEAAVAALHRQIAGATQVYLSGGDAEMIKQLSDALRGRGVSIREGSPIEIRFTGSVNPHGFGRKSRSASATVKKNGRPIFQYVMPREDYRVGDSPAEAFARILGDALER